MGSSNSKPPPQPERVFPNYETLMKSVNEIGPLVEKSESGPAKMCWIQLKTETEKQLRDKKSLEEEREQILKEEEEENGKEAAEKLRVALTDLKPNVLMSLIEKCSLRIRCHLLKVAASIKCFFKLQDDFGFIQTVVTNEMTRKIKGKVEELDWDELAELENFLDRLELTVTVTDANGPLISNQIQLDGD